MKVRIYKADNVYLIDGIGGDIKTQKDMAKKGWRWLRAPKGAGPGCYEVSKEEAERAASILGIEMPMDG